MSDYITLTEELLNEIRTLKGGYNRKQLHALDISWPPTAGWKRALTNTVIDKFKFIKYVQATGNLELITKYCQQLNIDTQSLVKKPAKLRKKEKHKLQNKLEKIESKEYMVSKIKLFGISELIKELEPYYITFSPFHKKIYNKLSLAQDNKTLLHANEMLKKYSNQRLHRLNTGRVVLASFNKTKTIRKRQYLYVIRAINTEHVKIGISMNPFSRLKELQTANPYKLSLSLLFETTDDAYKLEKSMHSYFKKFKSQGEWFSGIDNSIIIQFINHKAVLVSIKQAKEDLTF